MPVRGTDPQNEIPVTSGHLIPVPRNSTNLREKEVQLQTCLIGRCAETSIYTYRRGSEDHHYVVKDLESEPSANSHRILFLFL
jgi:hypothetical protein